MILLVIIFSVEILTFEITKINVISLMSRSNFLDYLKGIAIFLVVWGHSIQHLNTGIETSKNELFMFIYSFHMPLFMTISGYLFAFSKKRKIFEMMVKIKSKQLLLPMLYWAVPMVFLLFYKEFLSGDFVQSAIYFIKSYISILPYYLWFLWALFVISILVSLVANKFKDKVTIHILVFILLLCLTDRFGLMYMKFMYPYFLFGYFYNLYREKFIDWEKPLTYLSFVIFPVLLTFFWSKQDLIYQSGMSIYKPEVFKVIMISFKRYIIGLSGIVVVVTILKKILYFPRATFITKMGMLSLGIYIIQTIIFAGIDIFVPSSTLNYYTYTFVYTLTISVLIIISSIYFTKIFSKIPLVGKTLFGGRY
jgi:fucose 4-O-acetylase-like acetyltransferase